MIGRAASATMQAVDRWLFAPAPAARLAALRLAIGGFVTVWIVASAGEFARLVNRSPAEFAPVGIASLLETPVGASGVWSAFAILVALGLAFTVGVGFRVVGPLFALGVLAWASYHSSWGRLLHFEHLFTLHILVLGFSPAADEWSLRRRTAAASPPPSLRYGWPIRLMALATVLTYALSGVAKLRHTGLAWFGPDVLADHIAYSATRVESIGGPTPPLASMVLAAGWLIPPMAAAALAVELGSPFALLNRRLRNVWAVAAIGFHTATALTMWVWFGYRGLGFGLLPLFPAERIGALASRFRRPASPREPGPERVPKPRSERQGVAQGQLGVAPH